MSAPMDCMSGSTCVACCGATALPGRRTTLRAFRTVGSCRTRFALARNLTQSKAATRRGSNAMLSEIARTLAGIVDNAEGDLGERELTAAGHALVFASGASTMFLVDRCGGDSERARVEIARARDL